MIRVNEHTMKNVFLFLSLSFLLSSCSSDSDGDSTPKLFLTKVTSTSSEPGNNLVYNFTYNNGLVSQIIKTGDRAETFTFSYSEDNRIQNIVVTNNAGTYQYVISYDDNKKISGYTYSLDDYSEAWTYNGNNSYTIEGFLDFALNANGDIKSTDSDILMYDNKKGPFQNAKISYQFLGLIAYEDLFYYFGSKKPLSGINQGGQTPLPFTNSYNSDGYLSHCVTGTLALDYEYTEL